MNYSMFAQNEERDIDSVLAGSFRVPCPFGAGETSNSTPDQQAVPLKPIDGPPYWGVDCVAPAHKPLGDSPTLYDYVLANSNGRQPAFFGRYLTPSSLQRITADEQKFLRERNSKLLLNYNQLSKQGVAGKGPGARQSGKDKAYAAANLASDPEVGAPAKTGAPTIWIYANIDSGYDPSVEWIQGWWDGLWERGYAPGLYFPAGKDSAKVATAMNGYNTIPNIRAWCSVWSWAGSSKGTRNVSKNEFTTDLPPTYAECVQVWQYGGQCFKYHGDETRSFDMNLATQAGYDKMWRC